MRFVPTRAFGALVLAALTVVALTGATAFANSSGGGLSKYDRDLLRQARANGESTVTLIVAAKLGATKTAVKEIEALIRAGSRGGFTAVFRIGLGRCDALVVQAFGSRGNRAQVDVTQAACAPAP